MIVARMPSASTSRWPKPTGEDEFESIATDAIRLRWQDPNAQRYGRRGQKQHGIDIIGKPPALEGREAAAQCKNTDAPDVAEIVADAGAARAHKPDLAEFVVMTSASRDRALIDDLGAEVSRLWPGWSVTVMFWEDITDALSGNPLLIRKHWHFDLSGTPVAATAGNADRAIPVSVKDRIVWRMPRGYIVLTNYTPTKNDGWAVIFDYCDLHWEPQQGTHFHETYERSWLRDEMLANQCAKLRVPFGDWCYARFALRFGMDLRLSPPSDLREHVDGYAQYEPVILVPANAEMNAPPEPAEYTSHKRTVELRDVIEKLRHRKDYASPEDLRFYSQCLLIEATKLLGTNHPALAALTKIAGEFSSDFMKHQKEAWLLDLVAAAQAIL